MMFTTIRLSRKYMLIFAGFLISLPYPLISQGRYGTALSENSIRCLGSRNGNLYQGIDNYLEMDTTLISECDDIRLSSSNGVALKDSGNIYLLIPERTGKLRLSFECRRGSVRENMGYRYFQVLSVPDPQLMLNDLPINNPALIDKNQLLTCDSLSVFFSNDLIGSANWLVITEFQLGYNYGGFHVSHLNSSNQLSEETKEIIGKLGPEYEITIRPRVKALGNIQKDLPIYRIRIY